MIMRSFAVTYHNGTFPREGYFQANVAEFFGVITTPRGFALLTLCDEPVRAAMGLMLPPGVTPPAPAGAPRWDFFVRVDGEEPPPGRRIRCTVGENFGQEGIMNPRLLGGAAFGDGVAFVFVMPHEAPEGAEFFDV